MNRGPRMAFVLRGGRDDGRLRDEDHAGERIVKRRQDFLCSR